jgi:hypothetical protein
MGPEKESIMKEYNKNLDIHMMTSFLTLKDLGVDKLHGQIKKDGSSWITSDRVQGQIYGNKYNLLNNDDPLLVDIVEKPISAQIMLPVARFLIDEILDNIKCMSEQYCFQYVIEVSSSIYLISSGIDYARGENYNIMGTIIQKLNEGKSYNIQRRV